MYDAVRRARVRINTTHEHIAFDQMQYGSWHLKCGSYGSVGHGP